MKVKNYIYMLMAAMTLTSCVLEVPEIPAEELYLRNFIKTFGLIDPNQDWNLAEQSSITINLPKRADKVVVYGEIFGDYYRVARCFNADPGVIVIPLDVPVNTTRLAVEVDGVAYLAELGGTLNLAKAQPVSRANGDPTNPANIFLNEENILGWVIVAEDLGDTDDVDFNDFVARLSYSETEFFAQGTVTADQWDVIEQQNGDLIFNGSGVIQSRVEGMSRAGETVVSIKALAAGGIKKIYLHYRDTGTNTDYIIGPGFNTNDILTSDSELPNIVLYEWHRWFGYEDGVMVNTADPKYVADGDDCYENEIFITMAKLGTTINFTVPTSFSFTKYGQLTYESYDPTREYNFNFDRHTVEGFYITVDSPAYDSSNPAYDLGKVIGQNRTQGLPPQMFLIPDLYFVNGGDDDDTQDGDKPHHFRWPTERTEITKSYTKFGDWVKNGDVSWYRYGREDQVVSDNFLKVIYPGEYKD